MNQQAAAAWRRLGCAVIVQAWQDAQSTNGHKAAREAGISPALGLAGDARAFLASEGAAWLAAALELPADGPALAGGGYPPPEFEQLALSGL